MSPKFPTLMERLSFLVLGSFAVQFGDHFWSWIIGDALWGSFGGLHVQSIMGSCVRYFLSNFAFKIKLTEGIVANLRSSLKKGVVAAISIAVHGDIID